MSGSGARRKVRAIAAAGAALLALARAGSAQREIVPFVSGAIVDNRIRIGNGAVERVGGSVWGIGASTAISPLLGVRARIAGGTLTGRTLGAEDRGYSLAEVALTVTPDRWLTLDVGPVTRVLATSMVRQRWTEIRLGSTAGIALLDNTLRGTLRLAVSPLLSVTGQPSPDVAFATGTGLEYSDGSFSAALDYEFERYDFPASLSGRRLEQRTALTARVGWKLGWRWPLWRADG